jgi:hypothetical protein
MTRFQVTVYGRCSRGRVCGVPSLSFSIWIAPVAHYSVSFGGYMASTASCKLWVAGFASRMAMGLSGSTRRLRRLLGEQGMPCREKSVAHYAGMAKAA